MRSRAENAHPRGVEAGDQFAGAASPVHRLQDIIGSALRPGQPLQPAVSHEAASFAGNEEDFSTRRFVRLGASVVVLTFVVFGGAAAMIPIAGAVNAPGTLVLETTRKTIQHLEGGIVDEVLVRESQRVEAGEVLLRLDSLKAFADLTTVREELVALDAALARLDAEQSGRRTMEAPRLSGKDDAFVRRLNEREQSLLTDRMTSLDQQIGNLDQRKQLLTEAVAGLERQREAVSRQMASFEAELQRLREGMARGAVARNYLTTTERSSNALEASFGQLAADIARARETLAQIAMQRDQIVSSFREKAKTEARELEQRRSAVRERFNVAKDIYDRTEIRSPIAGVVQNIQVHTRGGVVRAGEPLMSIVPVDDILMVDARVRPLDIDSVKVGQIVEVRLPALSSRTMPKIEGSVSSLSPDIYFQDGQNSQPAYLARIAIDRELIPLPVASRLIAGMPADTVIRTERRTLLDYLWSPLETVLLHAFREE